MINENSQRKSADCCHPLAVIFHSKRMADEQEHLSQRVMNDPSAS